MVMVTRLQLHTAESQCLWALTGNTGVTLTENNIVNMMNKSIFDKTITVYNNAYDNVGRKQLLSEFLFGDDHREEITRIRATEDKTIRSALKRQLPCATVSGVFEPTRCSKNLKEHSGFICLDIDGQDNPNIHDWESLKWQLAAIPQIAYASLSVSAKGVFLLVPIKYPSCHKGQFLQLADDFSRMGITLDRNCSDICRLRTKSADDRPFINEHALVYNKVKVTEPPKPIRTPEFSPDNSGNIIGQVSQCCKVVAERNIDITSTYDSWIKVGFALASLGESGREFFHLCSSQNEKYDRRETDRKFDSLQRGNGGITIATFFKICKDYGVSLYH